jgi:competence protein ComEA
MSRADRVLVAAGASAMILALAAGWVLLAPGGAPPGAGAANASLVVATAAANPSGPRPASGEPATIVVDVEGAVLEPGIRELPAGSRVADALSAAGGYAADADIEAAAAAINLAERLTDGAQIVVPRVGASAGGPDAQPAGEADPGGDGGLVNLNTASPEELDALPGIGPVTVDRIVDARREAPFSSLQDAVDRGVLDRGQLQEIEGLATAS